MYCPKCGAQNDKRSSVCVNCGYGLPNDFAQPEPHEDIPDYLVESILCTICCCLPFGIVAIVYAAQVKPKIAAGDYIGARESSEKATNWCIASAIGSLIAILLRIILLGVD